MRAPGPARATFGTPHLARLIWRARCAHLVQRGDGLVDARKGLGRGRLQATRLGRRQAVQPLALGRRAALALLPRPRLASGRRIRAVHEVALWPLSGNKTAGHWGRAAAGATSRVCSAVKAAASPAIHARRACGAAHATAAAVASRAPPIMSASARAAAAAAAPSPTAAATDAARAAAAASSGDT